MCSSDLTRSVKAPVRQEEIVEMSVSLTQPLPLRDALRRLAMLIARSLRVRLKQRRSTLHLPSLPDHQLRDLGLRRTDTGWSEPFPSQSIGDPRSIGREL